MEALLVPVRPGELRARGDVARGEQGRPRKLLTKFMAEKLTTFILQLPVKVLCESFFCPFRF